MDENLFSDENDLDKAMKYIYAACDPDSTDRVRVSSLVDFILPYMKGNDADVYTLKNLLDPDDNDPEISSETFFLVMSNWAKKFNQEDSFHNISTSDLGDRPLVESTPRASFGNRQLQVYAEAAALDVSEVESGSLNNASILEKSVYEDHIKELMHQNKMCVEELALVRSQLAVQEEQNEILHSEFDKVTKQLKHVRSTNENLMKETKQVEDNRDNSFNKQKLIDKLKKQVAQYEKENEQLNQKLENLEHDRQKMEEKMVRVHEKLTKSRKEVLDLQAEIGLKEAHVQLTEDSKQALVMQISDLHNTIHNFKEKNHYLELCKKKVTKVLIETMSRHSETTLPLSKSQCEYSGISSTTQHQNALTTPSPTHQSQSPIENITPEMNKKDVPFKSPIKTSKFAFYNFDSPVAKQCSKICDIEQAVVASVANRSLQRPMNTIKPPPKITPFNSISSPRTPDLNTSLPNMYIVARTDTRKLPQDSLSFDESATEEEVFQMKLNTDINSRNQASLMDELAESLPERNEITNAVNAALCESCKDRDELRERVDQLCAQIAKLKTENMKLLQVDEELSKLHQRNNDLEDMKRSQETKITDLTRQIEKHKEIQDALESSRKDCLNLEGKLTESNAKSATMVVTIGELNKKLENADKERAILDDNILELQDAVSSLENTKKCLEITIKNRDAEKENLIEHHNMRIENFVKEVEETKCHIKELEKKFYDSCNDVDTMRLINHELVDEKKMLATELQLLSEQFSTSQTELTYYTNTIDNALDGSENTHDKLKALIVFKEKYDALNNLHEKLTAERRQQADEYQALEQKCNVLQKNLMDMQPQKKSASHERIQIQMEKLREKYDHLEDMLTHERAKQAAAEQQLQHAQRLNEVLISEKMGFLKQIEELNSSQLKNEKLSLETDINVIISSCNKLKHIMYRFSIKWKDILEQIPSINMLLQHLNDIVQADEFNESAILEIEQSKNDIQTISLIMDALANHTFEFQLKENKSTTPIPSSRPVSPDSPNLEAINTARSSASGAGDISNSYSYDSETVSIQSEDVDDPFDDLHNIYLPENLDALLRTVRFDEATPDEVRASVEEFVLNFMVDCNFMKTRLQQHFDQLKEVAIQLADQCRTFVAAVVVDSKNENHFIHIVDGIVKKIIVLSQSAERFGALQEEIKHHRTINTLIAHITHLNQKLDAQETTSSKCIKRRLSSELVYAENGCAVSDANQCQSLLPVQSRNRLLAMLQRFRPRSVFQLLNLEVMGFPFVGLLGLIYWHLILNGGLLMGHHHPNWDSLFSRNHTN